MKKLLAAMFVALLMVGCGGEAQNSEDSNDTENNASALAPFVDKWAEWEANPEPYGGLEVLAKIKEAKESNTTSLDLRYNKISDLSPLDGLTNLEVLKLYGNEISDLSPLKGLTKLKALDLGGNLISDLSPLAGLTNLTVLILIVNVIADLSPLKGLTNLEFLSLHGNFTLDEDQKAMLKKALTDCDISF